MEPNLEFLIIAEETFILALNINEPIAVNWSFESYTKMFADCNCRKGHMQFFY